MASFLGIDLTALDPDGIGEEGGMFRLNVFGAALPTLFGVWWDTRRDFFLFGKMMGRAWYGGSWRCWVVVGWFAESRISP